MVGAVFLLACPLTQWQAEQSLGVPSSHVSLRWRSPPRTQPPHSSSPCDSTGWGSPARLTHQLATTVEIQRSQTCLSLVVVVVVVSDVNVFVDCLCLRQQTSREIFEDVARFFHVFHVCLFFFSSFLLFPFSVFFSIFNCSFVNVSIFLAFSVVFSFVSFFSLLCPFFICFFLCVYLLFFFVLSLHFLYLLQVLAFAFLLFLLFFCFFVLRVCVPFSLFFMFYILFSCWPISG